MASYSECIQDAFSKGKISRELADTLSASQDPAKTIDELSSQLTQQKREAAIQAIKLDEAWRNINEYADGDPKKMYHGLVALLAKDPRGQAKYANIDYLQKVQAAKYHARAADILANMRTKLSPTAGRGKFFLGWDEKLRQDFVRAVYGATDVDPEIRKLADDWAGLAEEMRLDFNAAGGNISKNQRWLLPQKHDARNIWPPAKLGGKRMGRDEALAKWKDTIRPLLDTDQMVDDLGRPLSAEELEDALDYSFDSIVTGGMNKEADFVSLPTLGKRLSSKGSEKRFLYFKDAESWIQYQDMYGKGDILTTLTDHINGMAHDIATMQALGTNPRATFDALKNQIEKTVGLTDRQKWFSDSLFKTSTGRLDDDVMVGAGDFMQSTRNLLVASTLGKAFLSALSDVGFQVITSRLNGVPSFRALSRQLSLLNPANEADRIVAVKIGLNADAWVGRMHAANRYADTYGNGWTAKMAEGVMRGSLLEPWTDSGRKGFGMEFSSVLADNFGKTFDDLDETLLAAFNEYGIERADWDAFRRTKTVRHKNAQFADLTKGDKFARMVLTETDYAVPTPDARVQAITTGGLARNSIEGQAWRSAMMLKSFPITLINTHWYRAASSVTRGNRVAYMGAMLATTSVMGAIAMQAKDIAAGREPRPLNEDTAVPFLLAAVAQGGGLGIFGDFVFADQNRFGGGLSATALGPTGELLDKTIGLTLGNIQQAVKGEETNVLGEAAQFVKRYSPTIWQVEVAKGAMFDQLSLMADPDYEKRLRRIRRNRMKEYGQDYWWRPGEALPEAAQ